MFKPWHHEGTPGGAEGACYHFDFIESISNLKCSDLINKIITKATMNEWNKTNKTNKWIKYKNCRKETAKEKKEEKISD